MMMMSRRAAPGKDKRGPPVPRTAGAAAGKKKTPVFLYLVPLVPVLFMIFMSGKPAQLDDNSLSFMAPPPGSSAAGTAQAPEEPQEKAQSLSNLLSQQQQQQPVAPQETQETAPPPYKLVQRSETPLVQSPHTIVTGYFVVKSKSAKEEYLKWMQNMLSVQDNMVIFTSEGEMVDIIFEFRKHALNRTLLLTMPLEKVEMATKFDEKFWKDQFDKDIEKRVHQGFALFWIWLSKTYFVTQAIALNPYDSNIFMWSDIGCFRNSRYNDKTLIAHPEMVPADKLLSMAHHEPKPPPYIWWNDKYDQKVFFYHSGSQMIAYRDTWNTYHKEFWKTIHGFVQRDMFIGEDQTVLQSTCLREPNLCAYVPMDQVNDNHYFGLRHVMHNGGDYNYWYPPAAGILPVDRADVKDPKLLEKMPDPPRPSREKIKMA